MSNREEYNKIQQILGEDANLKDEEFEKKCAKKFMRARIAFYIAIIAGVFYLTLEGRILPENVLAGLMTTLIMLICVLNYLVKRVVFKNEIGRYVFRECYPDRGLARYLSFIPMMIHGQLYWSALHYNMCNLLIRLGKLSKATGLLGLMQDSCTTAGGMLWAEHVKQMAALYYEDFDMVIACGKEAMILYPKVRRTTWNQKVYSDLMTYAAYAECRKNNNYQGVCEALINPQQRPIDEVARQYYLYRAALLSNDYETAEKFRHYVAENAGTTWYGRAVSEGFVPERKPDNYPGFIAGPEKLQKPERIDRSRLKYLLIGGLIALFMHFVPLLFT